jgi:hypothetical protein
MERISGILRVMIKNIKKELQPGCTHSKHQAALAANFRGVASNICGVLEL